MTSTFKLFILEGNAVIKLVDKESSSGVFSISPEIMKELKLKHPPASEIEEDSLLYGPLDFNPPNIFDQIDERMTYNAGMKTKESAVPSGMDAELYRRILCSKNFHVEEKLLREESVTKTRNLLKTTYHPFLLESCTSCRLIPLDKNTGIHPIGKGEVLKPIKGKPVSDFLTEELRGCMPFASVCRPQCWCGRSDTRSVCNCSEVISQLFMVSSKKVKHKIDLIYAYTFVFSFNACTQFYVFCLFRNFVYLADCAFK